MSIQKIYPLIQSNKEWFIEASSGHRIYVEESGNPDGIPVIYCHGGPGGGTSPVFRSFFNPEVYRIIMFDQRGCGKSTPHAKLEGNDTWSLIEDMEVIREQLNIDKWVVSGGSWGSTLSLVYAISHPERVTGLILRGIFLGRKEDYDWLYGQQGGAAQIFPDFYDEFMNVIPDTPPGDEINRYYELLTSDNELQRLHAAKVWSIWEGRISTLLTKHDVSDHFSDAHLALSLARIECHYFQNNCFLEPDFIINNIHKINDIPGFIIHGRYDIVCKMENATTLDKHWEAGKLHIVPAAGHSSTEPDVSRALCQASDSLARFLTRG